MSGDVCYACDGTGERDPLSGAACYDCNGKGWKDEPDDYPCHWCDGTGANQDKYGELVGTCEKCHGTGREE